jgi:hypothetical protein
MARNVDKAANFILVQLTEQEPGIYDKSYPDYARQDKTDLTWEKISHEMESGICVRACACVHIYSIVSIATGYGMID